MFDVKPLLQKLLQRQKSLSMTQKDFAQLLGVSSPTVSRWRKGQGHYNPTLEQLGAIADKLGTTVVELLTPDTEAAQVTPAPAKKTTGKKADTKEDKTRKATTKTSAAKPTRSAKAKNVNEPTETAKKGRKTAVKAAKASATPAATADTEKTATKKRGRPKKVS